MAARAGNRLPIGKKSMGAHFFYLPEPPGLPQVAAQAVVAAFRSHVGPARASNIQSCSAAHLAREKPAIASELAQLTTALQELCGVKANADLLACRWVTPHTDESFEGSVFCSWVLHTGPSAYVMQTLHTQNNREGAVELTTNTRRLRVGDVLVFDPTTPHFAAPDELHQDSLLVLLQLELPQPTMETRRALLARLPPRAEDRPLSDFQLLHP